VSRYRPSGTMATMTDTRGSDPAAAGDSAGRPPRGKSAQRRIRIPPDPYFPALKRATEEGHEMGHVVTALLARYAKGELDV
jgi:hypothetical protein